MRTPLPGLVAVVGVVLAGVLVVQAGPGDGWSPWSERGDGGSASRTARVANVIDGDTLVVASGEHVRLIGIDTPERDQCGYAPATRALARMVEGRRVALRNPGSVQDRDTYDRLLRFVEVDGRDAGLALIRSGHAVARYDSRDGYDPHPREERYRAADRAHPSRC